MAPAAPLGSIRNRATLRSIEVLKEKLRRRQISGSHAVSLETATLLKLVVSNAKFSSIDELINSVKEVGRELTLAQPKEFASGNIVRKILRLIREEYRAFVIQSQATSGSHSNPSSLSSSQLLLGPSSSALSLSTFLLHGGSSRSTRIPTGIVGPPAGVTSTGFSSATPTPAPVDVPEWEWEDNDKSGLGGKKASNVKPHLIGAIDEVIDEVMSAVDNVAKGAGSHIHSTEIIITLGHSKTIEAFLKHAAKDRKFTVIIAETAPSLSGHSLARSLSSHTPPIPTLLIPDSNLFAFIPRCTKLLLPCSTILSTGGIFAPSGSLLAAKAAKAHSVQVIVCAGQYKLTPSWNKFQEFGAGDFGPPGEVLGFGEGGKIGDVVEVVNPRFDYVGPELLDVFLTDHGDHAPSYIYRLIQESYDDEDEEL